MPPRPLDRVFWWFVAWSLLQQGGSRATSSGKGVVSLTIEGKIELGGFYQSEAGTKAAAGRYD
jgi:hypothetical protein